MQPAVGFMAGPATCMKIGAAAAPRRAAGRCSRARRRRRRAGRRATGARRLPDRDGGRAGCSCDPTGRRTSRPTGGWAASGSRVRGRISRSRPIEGLAQREAADGRCPVALALSGPPPGPAERAGKAQVAAASGSPAAPAPTRPLTTSCGASLWTAGMSSSLELPGARAIRMPSDKATRTQAKRP